MVKDIFQATNHSNPWIRKIKPILQNLGFPFLNDSMYVLKPYLKQLKVRITDQCIQSQNARIQESSKLILFKNIHIEGSRPSYVDTLKYIKDRSAVCKIRF